MKDACLQHTLFQSRPDGANRFDDLTIPLMPTLVPSPDLTLLLPLEPVHVSPHLIDTQI
jgi:hypothetical protein